MFHTVSFEFKQIYCGYTKILKKKRKKNLKKNSFSYLVESLISRGSNKILENMDFVYLVLLDQEKSLYILQEARSKKQEARSKKQEAR